MKNDEPRQQKIQWKYDVRISRLEVTVMIRTTKIGVTSVKQDVTISEESPNGSIVISGMSGSGKTCRIAELEEDIVAKGRTVMEIDIDGSHLPRSGICNLILACKDGLNCSLMEPSASGVDKTSQVTEAAELLAYAIPLRGNRQVDVLREVLCEVWSSGQDEISEMKQVGEALKAHRAKEAGIVYSKLWPVIEHDIFRESQSVIKPHCLNIVSFADFDDNTKRISIEILLYALLKKMRMGQIFPDGLTVVIDEFQNLSLERRSALYQMLTEGRKYGLDLILATQTLSVFFKTERAALQQAAVQLYFRQSQSDIRTAAQCIERDRRDYWMAQLNKLKVGAAVAVGDLSFGGRTIQRPLITYSGYNRNF